MKTLTRAIFCFSLLLLSFSASQSDEPKLSLPCGKLNESQYNAILDERAKLIEELIQIANESPNISPRGSKHLAIKLLGKLKATEAITTLTNNLLFIPKDYDLDNALVPTQHYYVSVVALEEIGTSEDMMRALKYKISESKSEEERHLASWLLRVMLGEKQALLFLSDSANGAFGERKKNLLESVSYLKNFKQELGNPKYPWSSEPPLPTREEANRILFHDTPHTTIPVEK